MSFFRDNVTTSFYKKDWTESLKTKLFEIQQSKFFVTQSYIEKWNELDKMSMKEMKYNIQEWMERTVDWTPDIHAQFIANTDNDAENIIDLDDTSDEKKETLTAVMPCCQGDCKGIVTCAVRRETSVTSNYKCGLCQHLSCNKNL
jgi:hypothetical protein